MTTKSSGRSCCSWENGDVFVGPAAVVAGEGASRERAHSARRRALALRCGMGVSRSGMSCFKAVRSAPTRPWAPPICA